jgi:hypothetical protein
VVLQRLLDHGVAADPLHDEALGSLALAESGQARDRHRELICPITS